MFANYILPNEQKRLVRHGVGKVFHIDSGSVLSGVEFNVPIL